MVAYRTAQREHGTVIRTVEKIPEGAVIENRDGVKYTVWNDWDPTSEGCAKAVYNTTTKAVEWNMGESFMLEDGCTYQVRFKVWPSQKAYDLLADLNNGKKSYDSLTDAEKAQISEPTEAGGMYTLKTNSETSYTYREATKSGDTVTPTGDPSKPGSFPDVDPLELTTKPLKVQKLWHNNYAANVETVESITLELYDINASGQERQTFKTITLTICAGAEKVNRPRNAACPCNLRFTARRCGSECSSPRPAGRCPAPRPVPHAACPLRA